jgi:gephyrin
MSEGDTKLKAAILIVSDTASKNASTDKCIPVLKDVFGSIGDNQWEVTETGIVPDDVLAIQKNIRRWTDCEEPVNLIVTSGGTGFATKDVTPEVRMLTIKTSNKANKKKAVMLLLDRYAPGLV